MRSKRRSFYLLKSLENSRLLCCYQDWRQGVLGGAAAGEKSKGGLGLITFGLWGVQVPTLALSLNGALPRPRRAIPGFPDIQSSGADDRCPYHWCRRLGSIALCRLGEEPFGVFGAAQCWCRAWPSMLWTRADRQSPLPMPNVVLNRLDPEYFFWG